MGFHCESSNKCRNNSNPKSPDGDESYDKFLYFLLSGRMIRIECVDLFKMRSLSGAPGSNYILIEHLSLLYVSPPCKAYQASTSNFSCFRMFPRDATMSTMTGRDLHLYFFFYPATFHPPTKFSLAPKSLIGLKSMLGWKHFEISWLKEVLDPTVICKYV